MLPGPLYDSAGNLLASNDDYSPPDRDSQVDVTLVQGARYYFGITNYTNTGPGAYDYYLRAPK